MEDCASTLPMETFRLFLKDQRLKSLKFIRRKSSKGEKEKSNADCRESPSDADNASDSLSAPFLEEAISDFPADCFKNNVKDFATDYLNRADSLSNNDEIVTEVVYTALSAEVAAFAAEELIDMFLLEHLMRKMSFQGPRFSEKEHLSLVLDSLMLDNLLRQFFSIQQQQQATSENVPLRDFHLKAFTKVALDVLLEELNKVMEEDMEDLLDYERKVQIERCVRQGGGFLTSVFRNKHH